ncbi:hypothetical protein FBUS_01734 [Fasciolopsis buskii]|uniref:Uncharacterized protein n=1 Tax=Fasciolopsis buskii TaxID=27845 RepID=A0A8E0VS03_9TREM|nr:hypothetical protein FBUS_01734 [Fasciolopsis buski]
MPLFFPPQSVRDFVTLTLLHLIPALLALLEADKRNWHIYTTTSNTESDHDEVCGSEIQSRIGLPTVIRVSNTPPPRSSVDLPAPGTSHPFVTGKQFSEASSSLDEDTFYSIVSPLLNALSQFLCGQPVQLRTQPIPEHFGILDQITELLTNTTDEPQWEDFEKVTRCIADCLVLRSLCDALSSLFHGRYKLSTAAVIEPSQLHTNTDISSQFTEFAKQYDSAIRLLSEHLIDLSVLYCNSLIVDIPTDSDPTERPDASLQIECSGNVRVLNAFLRYLWRCMGHTCPAGLARQLLAHVGAQYLGMFVQLFSTEEYVIHTDPKVAK